MANEFSSTDITGTLRINGVDVTGGLTDNALAAQAILQLVGVDATAEGVIGGDAWLKVEAQSSPDLTVKVSQGVAFVGGVLAGQAAATASLAGFAAPATNPRIDIVQIADDGAITRKAGTEASSPSAPAVDADNLLLATVYNRVGQTSIKNSDDASNGYITDARVYV